MRPDRAQLWVDRPGPQVSGDRWLCKTGPVEEGEAVGQKKLTHLWHGVAPGSDGQTHRIFDRAQDWHARGRYFWTSGVARERSPDAGVESGMVTASRVSGEEQQCSVCGWCLCSGSRLSLSDSLGLGTLFLFPIPLLSSGYAVAVSIQHRDRRAVCVPGRFLVAPLLRALLSLFPELRLTTPRGLVRGGTNAKVEASLVRRQASDVRCRTSGMSSGGRRKRVCAGT